MEEQGCGYCLQIRIQDLHQALELLRRKQVAYRKVYMQLENGETEVMPL